MRLIYLYFMAFILSGCMEFRMSTIYSPDPTKNITNPLFIEFDSASFEHSMFLDRLKLQCITENKVTNSTLYSFYYFMPDSRITEDTELLPSFSYKGLRLLDAEQFSNYHKNYLIGDDTLLFGKGISGLEKFIKIKHDSYERVSGTPSENNEDIVTLFPDYKKSKNFSKHIHPLAGNSSSYISIPYNPYADSRVYTTTDFQIQYGTAIVSVFTQAKKESNTLKNIHLNAGKATSMVKSKDIVALYEYSGNNISLLSDSYFLISEFTNNEISELLNSDNNQFKGNIKYYLRDYKIREFGLSYMLLINGLTCFIPSLFGYPVFGTKSQLTLEAKIYDENNKLTDSYVSEGKGRSFSAMYWGYKAKDCSRVAQSKALKSALTGLQKKISKDK